MQFSFQYNGQFYQQEAKGCYSIAPELTVEVERRDIPEFNAVYWTVWFSNPSEKSSGILSEIRDCNTLFPLRDVPCRGGFQPEKGNLCVTTMQGTVDGFLYEEGDPDTANEFRLKDEYLAKKTTKTFENLGARSSDGIMPFFHVHAGEKGLMAAVGWTGSWRAEFSACAEGVKIKTGLQNTHFYLKPGEKVRTSSVLIMEYEGEDCSNQFRRLIRKHFSHCSQPSRRKEGLFPVEMWGGMSSTKMMKRIKEFQAAGVAFEELWIDAGWYGNCPESESPFQGVWSSYTGDWRINEGIHPEKLRDVKEQLARKGQNIMLWFEPERIARDSVERVEIYREHPEWLFTDDYGNTLLYYGEPKALDYVYDCISSYIESLNLGCYRQDFNMPIDQIFSKYEEEDRRGIMEIKHICGMYQLLDRLLERFPNLLIDDCSSGGRRIDIEMLRRSIPFYRSDYQCVFNTTPEILQAHNTNISTFLPYTGCTTKTKADTYMVRSVYSSSFGLACYSTAFQTMDEKDMEWAAAVSREYLSIREYFSKDFYNHGSRMIDLSSWAIWQYHDPDTRSGIVMAFRRTESPFAQAELNLKGLEPGKKYQFEVLDDGSTFCSDSRLTVTLPRPRSSTILRYRPA